MPGDARLAFRILVDNLQGPRGAVLGRSSSLGELAIEKKGSEIDRGLLVSFSP